MPFKSESQRRWMHANDPEMADEWEDHTPKKKKLPNKVRKAALQVSFHDPEFQAIAKMLYGPDADFEMVAQDLGLIEKASPDVADVHVPGNSKKKLNQKPQTNADVEDEDEEDVGKADGLSQKHPGAKKAALLGGLALGTTAEAAAMTHSVGALHASATGAEGAERMAPHMGPTKIPGIEKAPKLGTAGHAALQTTNFGVGLAAMREIKNKDRVPKTPKAARDTSALTELVKNMTPAQREIIRKAFDEQKHRRDPDGKFGGKNGMTHIDRQKAKRKAAGIEAAGLAGAVGGSVTTASGAEKWNNAKLAAAFAERSKAKASYLGTRSAKSGNTKVFEHARGQYGAAVLRSAKAGKDAQRAAHMMHGGAGAAVLGTGAVLYGEHQYQKHEKAARWDGVVSKVDEDKRQVFGWASVVEIDGQPVVDKQGDYLAPTDMENAAYDFVLKSRIGGDNHRRVEKADGGPHHVSDMIESFVLTPEKADAMGIGPINKTAWWVGFKVHDDDAWDMVKKGERTGFSIHGMGRRVEKSMDEIDPVVKSLIDHAREISKNDVEFGANLALIVEVAKKRGDHGIQVPQSLQHPDAAIAAGAGAGLAGAGLTALAIKKPTVMPHVGSVIGGSVGGSALGMTAANMAQNVNNKKNKRPQRPPSLTASQGMSAGMAMR